MSQVVLDCTKDNSRCPRCPELSLGLLWHMMAIPDNPQVKTTEQSLRGNIHTSRSLADYLKSELLVHASGEPENKANKRTHVLIIA